jgi:plasmid stabilization system protein ParE
MPASKPYRFHPQAWQEVEAAESWYRQRNPEASVRFLSAIYDALESLTRWSRRWPTDRHGARRFILYRFPFSIIYRDEDAGHIPSSMQRRYTYLLQFYIQDIQAKSFTH